MSDMTKQWFSVAFHGLTKEKRDELIDMECAQVMGHSNVFDERDALKARVAELEAQLAVAPVVAQVYESGCYTPRPAPAQGERQPDDAKLHQTARFLAALKAGR